MNSRRAKELRKHVREMYGQVVDKDDLKEIIKLAKKKFYAMRKGKGR